MFNYQRKHGLTEQQKKVYETLNPTTKKIKFHNPIYRRKLVPGRVVLMGQEIDKIDWAEPENEVDEEIMATVSFLFFILIIVFRLTVIAIGIQFCPF
jgi:hypothetical protein